MNSSCGKRHLWPNCGSSLCSKRSIGGAPSSDSSRFRGIRRVERDFSLILADGVTFAQVAETIRGLQIPELESIEAADLFRGGQIPAGKFSLMIRVTFQSAQATLTEAQVSEFSGRIVKALQEKLGRGAAGELNRPPCSYRGRNQVQKSRRDAGGTEVQRRIQWAAESGALGCCWRTKAPAGGQRYEKQKAAYAGPARQSALRGWC